MRTMIAFLNCWGYQHWSSCCEGVWLRTGGVEQFDFASRTRRVSRKPRVKKYMPLICRARKNTRMTMNLRIALSVGLRLGVVDDGLEGMTFLDGRGLVVLLPLTRVGGEDVEGDMRV